MKQMPLKKLVLKKTTISRLNENGTKQMNGASYTTISVVYTNGCMTDITRTSIRPTTTISGGPSYSG